MSHLCLLFVSACLAASPDPDPVPAPPAAPPRSSEAERIARLQNNLEKGEKELADITRKLNDPDSDFQRSQKDLKDAEERLTRAKRDAARLRTEGKTAEADALDKEIVALQTRRAKAKERADTAVEERKTLQEAAKVIAERIEREKKSLERMLGTPSEKKEPEKKEPAEPKKDHSAEAGKPKSADKPSAEEKPAEEKSASIKEDGKLREAREQARAKEEAAEKAHEKAKRITEHLDGLKRQIELEQRLLTAARKKIDLARRDQAELEGEQKARVEKKAPEEEINAGLAQINDALRRVQEAAADEREITDRLADLQEQLARVQGVQIRVLQETEKTDLEASSARKTVEKLENPFNPRNVMQWLLDHGGKMLAIVLGMTVLYILVRTSSRKFIQVMASAGKRNSGRESEDRAETLVGVFRTTMSAFVIAGGVLMLLDEVGIPIVPLMGGAAVLGLAVAFGAQNLIKDYFTGFMVLMEDQYAVNDIVKINGVGGKVERITLRMTVLRDNAGVAHFVPHGAISTVSNMSHGWSRVNMDVGISYKEDVDRVMGILKEICAGVRRDDRFGPLILEDAEMLGVDALGDSAVVVKFVMKTRPLKQFDVKRELLRRIKKRFDEEGIEIPFPHRTIYHHHERPAESTVDRPRLVA